MAESGGDSSSQSAETKCTIKRDSSGYFHNPFPEFKFLSPYELYRFLLREKDNTNLPSKESEIDRNLPFKKNFDDVSTSAQNSVTWIGHATCLLKLAGSFVLTDPVFSQHCSAVQLNLSKKTKRFRQPGLNIEEIEEVDAVVISHNHYDHLDYNSVLAIKKKFPNSLWFVPLGLKSWFRSSGIADEKIHEMNWWDEKSHTFKNGELTFTCLPAQHWSMRTGLDRNYSLWCGWRIKSSDKNVYFAGDTGYNDRIFKQIGQHFGPFDLSLIPIGAYEPRKYLKCQHVNPEEAVLVHQEVKSKWSLGIHWGTFQLGYEHYMAPPKDLKDALNNANVKEESFVTFQHGESREF